MNYHQLKKKNRPLTPDEQAGMLNLLSGLNMLRELATGKQSVTLAESGRDVIAINPTP